MRYAENEKYVLKGINFNIAAGEKVLNLLTTNSTNRVIQCPSDRHRRADWRRQILYHRGPLPPRRARRRHPVRLRRLRLCRGHQRTRAARSQEEDLGHSTAAPALLGHIEEEPGSLRRVYRRNAVGSPEASEYGPPLVCVRNKLKSFLVISLDLRLCRECATVASKQISASVAEISRPARGSSSVWRERS